MPHCVIETSSELKKIIDLDLLVKEVHDTTEKSGLFEKGDVKSRLLISENYLVGGVKENYVHIVTHILSGRSETQRKSLADSIALTLCDLLPTVEMLSVEVREINKKMYSNRNAVKKI